MIGATGAAMPAARFEYWYLFFLLLSSTGWEDVWEQGNELNFIPKTFQKAIGLMPATSGVLSKPLLKPLIFFSYINSDEEFALSCH